MSDDETIQMSGVGGEERVFSTVAAQRGEVESFDLKPSFVSLELPASTFRAEFKGNERSKTFDASIGGGTTFPGVLWFFLGEEYVRYDVNTNDLSGPATIAANWGVGTWPPMFASGVDAAISFTSEPDLVWFFKGENYIRYHLVTDAVDGPAPIAGNWHGLAPEFASGVDAAIQGRGDFEGMGWFFKGTDYVRFNALTNQMDLGPRPISDGWHGWPDEFTRVDCAVSGSGAQSKLIYFFCADRCFAYDLAQDAAQGPVRQISDVFPVLAPFLKHPQLFLVETLTLNTYFGDISAGAPQAGGRSLDPHEKETYTVIVTHDVTESISQTSTVLESQNESLVDDLNTSMNQEAAKARATESYDYKFDSSFNGDLSYTGLGGSVDATLNFQGSSNDVRQNAAAAARSAVQKQVSRAEQSREQSTRVQAGSEVEHTATESTFTKTVSNPTDHPINIGVFQLFQEYLGLVSLTDVQVGFSNGGKPTLFPLSEIHARLATFVDDEDQMAAIEHAIRTELSALLDYRNTPVDTVSDLGDGRFAFSRELTSLLQLTNADGSLRREIVVPGLLIDHYSFKQLTEAMIIRELGVG